MFICAINYGVVSYGNVFTILCIVYRYKQIGNIIGARAQEERAYNELLLDLDELFIDHIVI